MEKLGGLVSRIVLWRRDVMMRLKKHSWRWWAAVGSLLFVVQEVVLSFIPGIATGLGQIALKAVIWFGGQPMWAAGAVLLVFLLALLCLSWWETRPKIANRLKELEAAEESLEAMSRQLRESEKRITELEYICEWGKPLINEPTPFLTENDLVVVRNASKGVARFAIPATKQLHGLVGEIGEQMINKKRWAADLLMKKWTTLGDASNRFTAALKQGQDAREALASLYQHYCGLRGWLIRFVSEEGWQQVPSNAYKQFTEADKALFAAIEEEVGPFRPEAQDDAVTKDPLKPLLRTLRELYAELECGKQLPEITPLDLDTETRPD